MPTPSPTVRNLIVCEEVIVDRHNPHRFTLVGILDRIRSGNEPPYPHRHEKFGVFVQLTECRVGGEVRVDVLESDTNNVIFNTPTQKVTLPNNPLAVHLMRFRIRNCDFRAPGLYWVQFVFDNHVLYQQSLTLC
jgi:hypothetical protein